MSINQEGLELIKNYEGLRLKAYYCPARVLTIGYGNTNYCREIEQKFITDNKQLLKDDPANYKKKYDQFINSIVIDENKAEDLLKNDLKFFENFLNNWCQNNKVTLTVNEYSALISFIFNLGANNFKNSTLAKRILAGRKMDAAVEFGKWNKAAGKVLKGLSDRRNQEMILFLKP